MNTTILLRRIASNTLLVPVMLLVLMLAGNARADLDTIPSIADVNSTGQALVERYFGALQAGDRDQVAAILSPAFQIVRATGTVHDYDSYLADLPVVNNFAITDARATLHASAIVVSYIVTTHETLEGVEQTTRAPRLTTFRWDGSDWRLVSHANFGAMH